MTHSINRAAVVGAGTMGAAIAAHLANAGIPVVLLDAVPTALTPDEEKRKLTLQHPAVRNRLVRAGLERAVKASPANFASPDFVERVTTGNTEDDLQKLADTDWIVEAIFENLEAKQKLMAQIESVRKPHAIVSSNTSGIPIAKIADGRSDEFKKHFLGMHFFNPPRYLRLLEIIPTPDSDPAVVAFMKQFAERVLGKGVVLAKDTPNFVGNRIFSLSSAFALNTILDNDYTVEEVDALTGPLIGYPKTATFRLLDLVGLDIAQSVGNNLYDLVATDESRELLRHERSRALNDELMKRKWIGNKAGQGFYKEMKGEGGRREFWALDLNTLEYKPPSNPRFESVGRAKDVEPLGERLKMLVRSDDRAGTFLWQLVSFNMAYASRRVPEIADEFYQIDNALKSGFSQQLGPFEMWDALGVAETVQHMEADGTQVASWVKEMLDSGHATFYQYEGGRKLGFYDLRTNSYQPLPRDASIVSLADLKSQGKELQSNESASLIDLGDGVLCFEFHTKTLNALDPYILDMAQSALEELQKPEWVGMVIGNEGEAFCAGANVFTMAMLAQQGQYDELETFIAKGQQLMQAMRFSPKPIVAAPAGMALGGGAEIVMAASRAVAHLEAYIGQVEVGVGLIPAGGGVKELLRRNLAPIKTTPQANPQPFVSQVFQTISQAKVSTSAFEARALGFLSERDRIVFNREQLIGEAKREVLNMVHDGCRAPIESKNVFAVGRDGLAMLKIVINGMRGGNYVSDYDTLIGKQLANVVAGGDLSLGQWVSEQYILDLEREAFINLMKQPKTLERIWSFLQTGKAVRN